MPEPRTDQLVRAFIKIRDARSELTRKFDADDDDLKQKQKMIEIELLRRAMAEKVEGFTTKDGTTYIAEEVHASIADDDAFYGHIAATGDYLFLERRPSLKHIKEYQSEHDGGIPPGIRLFRENRMRVRAKTHSRDKGGADES